MSHLDSAKALEIGHITAIDCKTEILVEHYYCRVRYMWESGHKDDKDIIVAID